VIQGKHNKPIATLAWSPKQNLLVSAGDRDDKNIFLWDVATLTQKGQVPKEKASLQFNNVEEMLAVWSPAGDIVAIANAEASASIGKAQILVYKSDFSDYAPGFSSNFAINDAISFAGLAWGESYFYTVHHPFSLNKMDLNAKDQILVWDPKAPQKPVSAIPIDNLFMSSSDDISKTSNNKYIDVATNPVLLRAQANGAVRITLGTHEGILIGDVTMVSGQAQWQKVGLMKFDESDQYAPADVGAISWGNFGQHLAAIQQCLSQPKIVKVFDFAGKTYQMLNQHDNATGGLATIAWNPVAGSQILAGGSEDGKIDIWDYSRAKLPIRTISPPASVTGIVKALAWSADGAWLAAAHGDTNASLVIWKI
jgi:WD40 repeat protein